MVEVVYQINDTVIKTIEPTTESISLLANAPVVENLDH